MYWIQGPVNAAMKAATGHVGRARKFEEQGKTDNALDAYNAALRASSDCDEALEGRSRCSPEPPNPTETATATATGITVAWETSRSRGRIRSHFVRKQWGQPAHPDDGDVLGPSPQSPLTDAGAEPGRPYYYAVYAEREGVRSEKAAVAGPIVRPGAGPVANFRA